MWATGQKFIQKIRMTHISQIIDPQPEFRPFIISFIRVWITDSCIMTLYLSEKTLEAMKVTIFETVITKLPLFVTKTKVKITQDHGWESEFEMDFSE